MRAGETSPLHMVSALLTEAGIVLGQTAVDGKSNEIPAMAELLELLDIEGALAAADAMHAQRHAAELIIGKDGDCALALKANQGSLRKDAKEWLEDPEAAKEMLPHQHVGGRGRAVTRAATVSHDIGWLQDAHRWPGLQAVGKIEAVREAGGRPAAETRYFIMSRRMTPEELPEAVRSHWAIKNRLHWVLDVQMREDDLRNRAGHGPANLAAVRRPAASIDAPHRQAGHTKALDRMPGAVEGIIPRLRGRPHTIALWQAGGRHSEDPRGEGHRPCTAESRNPKTGEPRKDRGTNSVSVRIDSA